MELSEFDLGYLLGLLVGEGHFGGDGKQPHVVLRMHVRHSDVFAWMRERVPGGRLYGPYEGRGRIWYQFMIRGTYLKTVFLPVILPPLKSLDSHVWGRAAKMCDRYGIPR